MMVPIDNGYETDTAVVTDYDPGTGDTSGIIIVGSAQRPGSSGYLLKRDL